MKKSNVQNPIPKSTTLNESLQKSISPNFRKGYGSFVTEETRNYILKCAETLGPDVYKWAQKASAEELGELLYFNNVVFYSKVLFFTKLGPGHDTDLINLINRGWEKLNRNTWEKTRRFFFPDDQF